MWFIYPCSSGSPVSHCHRSNHTTSQYHSSIKKHYCALWARWRLKSPASRLFTQPFVQAQIKENIKAPRHWPLCGGIHRWPVNSPHKRPITRKCLHLMTSPWDTGKTASHQTKANHKHEKCAYRQPSNIIRIKSQDLNVSRFVSHLSLANPLWPGVKSRMKIELKQRRQAML